jgi:hypothetical protein
VTPSEKNQSAAAAAEELFGAAQLTGPTASNDQTKTMPRKNTCMGKTKFC